GAGAVEAVAAQAPLRVGERQAVEVGAARQRGVERRVEDGDVRGARQEPARGPQRGQVRGVVQRRQVAQGGYARLDLVVDDGRRGVPRAAVHGPVTDDHWGVVAALAGEAREALLQGRLVGVTAPLPDALDVQPHTGGVGLDLEARAAGVDHQHAVADGWG